MLLHKKTNILIAIVIFGFFSAHASPYCLTTYSTDKDSGTQTSQPAFYAGCTCPCTHTRYSGSICSECNHKIVEPTEKPFITDSFKTIAEKIESLFKRLIQSIHSSN